MKYKRHYVQFNDLVFDEYDMTSEGDASVAFKEVSQEYSFRHGDYVPFKGTYVSSGSVTMTLELRMKKLPCDMRKYYRRFVIEELTKPGKLWAVQDNTLVWAYAYIQNYAEDERGGSLEVDVSFALPEGVWHKASAFRTFLHDFDVCRFLDCKGYKDAEDCECCSCETEGACDCCCEELTRDMALCYHKKEIQNFYDCTNPWRIEYNCEAGEDFFGADDPAHIGQKVCSDFNCGVIIGQFYSDTELPADVRIKLHGKFNNPVITINDNTNIIYGEYEGFLYVNPDGSVYLTPDETCEGELVDVSAWGIPSGNEYGWKAKPGYNTVNIDTGVCEGISCAYIETDALTI